MTNYAKWLWGGLGWAFMGPIGGIIGFAIGSLQDMAGTENKPYHGRTQAGDFGAALLVLAGAVMKADGKILKSELNYVRDFFSHQFGSEHANERMLLFREILKQDIHVKEVCDQIRDNMTHPSRLQLLHFLFGVSGADGHIDSSEVNTIHSIAGWLGISQKDFESIKAMFVKDSSAAYKILEVDENATPEEVKKAYRRMAVKYHPDKVAHLGEDFRKAANEKFQKVNEAYETVKKQKGFS
ncbi:MAG: TerB family tellurite resistance protein [Flavobacteriales bacterium]|nr:TerB family tellurite resistance protein [Flavobacteriales bacterium]